MISTMEKVLLLADAVSAERIARFPGVKAAAKVAAGAKARAASKPSTDRKFRVSFMGLFFCTNAFSQFCIMFPYPSAVNC